MKTSKIHEEMVIKANKFRIDFMSGVYGSQGYPGTQGYQMSLDTTRRKYICKNDESYISVFTVCSVFKDEIYEGVLTGYDDLIMIYNIDEEYSIGVFNKINFYSIAELRDMRIDEILNDHIIFNEPAGIYP